MGTSYSINPLQQSLSELEQFDYSQDPAFWSNLLQQIPSDFRSHYWYPDIIYRIAKKQPANIIKLISFCGSFIDNIKNSEITPLTFNQLTVASQIFTCSCSVVLSTQSFSAIVPKIRIYIRNYLYSATKCLLIPQLTGITEFSSKPTDKSDQFIRARYDILHSLLCLANLNYFTRFIENPPLLELTIPDFPGSEIFKMLSELSDTSEKEMDLLKNCVALTAKIGPQNAESIGSINHDNLLDFFLKVRIDQYYLTFLLQSAYHNKQFVNCMHEKSKDILFKILNYAQMTLEKGGISFIHTIAANTIQIILENDECLSYMNDPFEYEFTTKFQPQQGNQLTFADALIEVLFNICNTSSLLPIFASIVEMISLKVTQLSVFCSVKTLDVFTNLSQTQNEDDTNKIWAVQCLLESFANIVQRPQGNDFFRVIIAQRTAAFQFAKKVRSINSPALEIVLKYLATIREKILKENMSKIDIFEINDVVLNIDVKSIFPTPLLFQPKPFTSAHIEKAWLEWCEVFFLQSFKPELDAMKQLEALTNL